MTSKLYLIAAAAVMSITLQAPAVYAAASDYTFEPAAVDVKNGTGSELAVRLINKQTGKAVPDAIVIRTRLDMSPESMGEMTAKHTAMPSTEPGVYRFKADLTMAGGWAFKLQAKVPGETETVEGSVVFKAK